MAAKPAETKNKFSQAKLLAGAVKRKRLVPFSKQSQQDVINITTN